MFNAVIVGGGSIGALKPKEYDSPCSEHVLTHAHALYHFRKNKLIDNFYIVDPDYKKRAEIGKRWKCKTFKNLNEFHDNKFNIDIFIISVPTELHANVLDFIIEHKIKPKIIIVEKPFCDDYIKAHKYFMYFKGKDIPIVVNYTRRFCPEIHSLKNKLTANGFGKIKACNIIYVRGLVRDACHALDLCNYFFGEFVSGKILGDKHNAFDDYTKEDLTVPVWMEYENCKNVYLTPADGRDYSIFEFDILTENARINIIDHSKKTKIFLKEPEKVYGKFHSMNYEANKVINNDLYSALLFLHGNVLGYLQSDKKEKYNLFCTGMDGVKVQKIFSNLLGE